MTKIAIWRLYFTQVCEYFESIRRILKASFQHALSLIRGLNIQARLSKLIQKKLDQTLKMFDYWLLVRHLTLMEVVFEYL